MSIEKPDNERLELYNRFRKSLADGDADSGFYDADDLVIIHDQAVDLDDQYVQIETLMRGFRYFPDNEELATRRGFLYYDLSLDQGVRDMLATHTDPSPMWELLKVRLNEEKTSGFDVRSALDRLLALPGTFDDETAIQLVDAASAAGQYDWLKANEKALRKKTEYLPSLLYELFVVADMQPDTDYALKLLEELTEIEPFNMDFWLALAQTHLRNDSPEEALTACDYALAISSDDVNVLTTKATAYGRLGMFSELLDMVSPILARDSDSPLAESKVRALFALGGKKNFAEAMSLLKASIERHPESRSLHGLALEVQMPELNEALMRHYDACSDEDRNDWPDWARRLYIGGHPDWASDLLTVLDKRHMIDYPLQRFYASALYTGGRYELCAEVFMSFLDTLPKKLSPDLAVAGFLSMLRMGRKADCRKAYRKFLGHFPLNIRDDWRIGSTLEALGFSSFVSMLGDILKRPGKIDVDSIDIFQLPSNYNDELQNFEEY